MASFAVELRDVGKRFGSVVALDRVDLAIRKGEFFSLLGPSGCGKTTTLNLIGGFEAASRGSLLIDGQPMGDTPSHARPVNTVFQSYALFPHMSVADNVGFGLRMKKVPQPERERRWHLGRQLTTPPSLHVVLTPIHAPVVDDFLRDLREVADAIGRSGRTGEKRSNYAT